MYLHGRASDMPRVLVAGDSMVKYLSQYFSSNNRVAVEVRAFSGIRIEALFSKVSDTLLEFGRTLQIPSAGHSDLGTQSDDADRLLFRPSEVGEQVYFVGVSAWSECRHRGVE